MSCFKQSCFQRMLAGVAVLAMLSCVAGPVSAQEKVTFTDHVLPLFRAKCNMCHSADQAKGGLVLDNYAAVMTGGASGPVIEETLDDSRLWLLMTHKEQPVMPPKEPKLPDDQLTIVQKWFAGGLLETATSQPRVAKMKKSFSLGTTMVTTDKPEGPPPMPENLSTEPLTVSARGNAVSALAASPWAPLLAVAGHKQVILYDLRDGTVAGVLPFPEGTIHVLRFSRNGSLLLAAGGRGGQSGKGIVFDVKTGKRVSEVGDEHDAVLAADISPNHGMVALGGPKKLVRVYDTSNGELLYEIKKHTDWVTAIEFSPDGVLLASGDRSNGLFVWEAANGREFYPLTGHGGTITGLSWRIDSNVLASSSEDTTVRLWEMTNGTQIKSWGAHGGGASSVAFLRDGRLVSTGRDRVTKLWDQNGAQQKAYAALADLGLKVTYSETTSSVIAGDWTGAVRGWQIDNQAEVATLATNPAPLDSRLQVAQAGLTQAQAAATAAAAQLAALQKVFADKKAAAEVAVKAAADAAAVAAAAVAAKAEMDKQLAAKVAAVPPVEAAFNAANAALAKTKAEKEAVEKANDLAQLRPKTEAFFAAEKAAITAKANLDLIVVDRKLAEFGVNEAAGKMKVTADAAVAMKAVADKAVAEMNPTPDQQKQLDALTAAANQSQATLAARKAVVDKLAAEKARLPQQTASAAK